MIVLGVIICAGLYYASSMRDWGQQQFDANRARTHEFDRRVSAQRVAALHPELAQAGIHVEEAPMGADSSANVQEKVAKPTIMQRIRGLWYRVKGAPPPPPEPEYVDLTDSLGLQPGERAYLPGGRIVEYDTTNFNYRQHTRKQ